MMTTVRRMQLFFMLTISKTMYWGVLTFSRSLLIIIDAVGIQRVRTLHNVESNVHFDSAVSLSDFAPTTFFECEQNFQYSGRPQEK